MMGTKASYSRQVLGRKINPKKTTIKYFMSRLTIKELPLYKQDPHGNDSSNVCKPNTEPLPIETSRCKTMIMQISINWLYYDDDR